MRRPARKQAEYWIGVHIPVADKTAAARVKLVNFTLFCS